MPKIKITENDLTGRAYFNLLIVYIGLGLSAIAPELVE